ncbi:MAG: hypothetical protein ABI557_21020, partial [Aureliella sp.]
MSRCEEPPVVLPPTKLMRVDHGKGVMAVNHIKSVIAASHSVEAWLDRAICGESYGAPRVFDLFTLLAITMAFALMFALLRAIEPILMIDITGVALCLGALVTGVGIFQLSLWGGKRPRLASLVGGPFLVLGLMLAGGFWQFGGALPRLLVNA